jgi:hypothetical protein
MASKAVKNAGHVATAATPEEQLHRAKVSSVVQHIHSQAGGSSPLKTCVGMHGICCCGVAQWSSHQRSLCRRGSWSST